MLNFITEFFQSDAANSIFNNVVGGFKNLLATRLFFSLFICSFAIYVVKRVFWG